jgi:glycogen(starch) synthase
MTTDTVGGVWQYALSLCGALQAAGVEIVLASMGRPLSPAQRAAAAELDNVMMAEGRFRLEWMQDAEHDVADSGIWLLALAERHDVDLVHVNGYAHAALPFGRPVVAVAHSDVVSWFAAVKGEPLPAAWEHYRRAVELGLSHADAVVAPTEAVARDLARNFGFAANRTRVIPNGIALAHYAPAPKRPFILSAGRLWDEAKNIEQLDRIAPQIAWPIEIAGEGQHPDGGGQNLAAAMPLGVLTCIEMRERLAAAAIYAAPARYEPFGLAILEAAASGCALVLGDIPSLWENWRDAAIFIPPGDDAALIAALNGLIADEAGRAALAERAHARSRAFDIARTASDYLSLYRTLVTAPALIDA